MKILYIILSLVILILVVYGVFLKITESRFWRIRQTLKAYRKDKEEGQKEAVKIAEITKDFISDENQMFEIISKLKSGELVEIPYTAFEYIYRNIDSISTVGKDGTVKILDYDKYEEFKETAMRLLNDDKHGIAGMVELADGEDISQPYTVEKTKEGDLIRRDNVKGTILVKKADGTKIFNDMRTNEVFVTHAETDEDDNSKSKDNNKKNEKSNRKKQSSDNLELELKKANQKLDAQIDRNKMLNIANNLKGGKKEDKKDDASSQEKIEVSQVKNKNKLVKEDEKKEIKVAVKNLPQTSIENNKENDGQKVEINSSVKPTQEKTEISNQNSVDKVEVTPVKKTIEKKEILSADHEAIKLLKASKETFQNTISSVKTIEIKDSLDKNTSLTSQTVETKKDSSVENSKELNDKKIVKENQSIKTKKSKEKRINIRPDANEGSEVLGRLNNLMGDFTKKHIDKKVVSEVNENFQDNDSEIESKIEHEESNSLSSLLNEIKNQTLLDKELKQIHCRNIVFDDDLKFVNGFFSYGDVLEFMVDLVNVSDKYYMHCYAYDQKKDRVLISTELFLLKAYAHFTEDTRDEFLKVAKPRGLDVKDINNEVMFKLILALNKVLSIKFAEKPFYLKETERHFFVKRYISSVVKDEYVYYEGFFLQLNLNNSLGSKLKEMGYINNLDSSRNFIEEKNKEIKYKLITVDELLKL